MSIISIIQREYGVNIFVENSVVVANNIRIIYILKLEYDTDVFLKCRIGQ